MNKKSLIIYFVFTSFLFSENNFFVKDWHEFYVQNNNGKLVKIKGRLIYQDPGNEQITYRLENKRLGAFTLKASDLVDIRFAMKNDESISGIALGYDIDTGSVKVRRNDTKQEETLLVDDIRFIYFNYKNDNTRIAKFVDISYQTTGGYILVKEKYNQPKTTRYNLNCNYPMCEDTSKRKKKDNFMPMFIWKKMYKK